MSTELLANSPVPGTVTALGTLTKELALAGMNLEVSAAAPTELRGTSSQFRVVIGSEILIVEAPTSSVLTWKILERKAEGSTEAVHAKGVAVYHDPTAGGLKAAFLNKASNLSDVADAGSSRANVHVPELTPAVAVATTNVAKLEGLLTIDGVTLEAEQLVLLTAQSESKNDGLWLAASGAWTRPTEFATGLVIKGSRTVAVTGGTANARTFWLLKVSAAVTVGTSAQTWELLQSSSVANSSGVALGKVPMANGSNGVIWEQGLGGTIDIRELIEGVTQNSLISASALKSALEGASFPPGATLLFPTLGSPIDIIGEGEVPFKKATVYRLESAIELPWEMGIAGGAFGFGGVVLRAEEGFTDSQIVRNWKSTDWQAGRTDTGCEATKSSTTILDTKCVSGDVGKVVRDARASEPGNLGFTFGIKPGMKIVTVNPGVSFTISEAYVGATGTISCIIGEPDHAYAPVTTAVQLFYPRVENICLDVNGASGVTCLARVHPQEQALLNRVIYWNSKHSEGTKNYGRTDFANSDSGGSISGILTCSGEIQYGYGWISMILQDSSCGGKKAATFPGGGQVLRDLTTASIQHTYEVYESSPLKFIQMGDVELDNVHCEAVPIQEGPTRVFTDGTAPSASTTLTTAGSIIFSGHLVGRAVSDSESAIPTGTIITKILTATTVELSAPTTKKLESGATVTIGPDDASIRLFDCAAPVLAGHTVTAHFGEDNVRPWLRHTASATTPGSVPIMSPLILGAKVTAASSEEWKAGAAFLEDYPGDGVLRRLVKTASGEAFDPRMIMRYDGEEMVWADGTTPTMKKARLHPRGVPDNEIWTPARQGFIAANGDPLTLASGNTVQPGTGVLELAWIPTPWNFKLSDIYYYLYENSGNTFTEHENFVGIYAPVSSTEAKLIAATADLSAAWGSAGSVTKAVVTPLWQSVGGPRPTIGIGVWMAILLNGTISKMKFGSLGAGNGVIDAGTGVSRAGTYGTLQTELPATLTLASITGVVDLIWGAFN